VRSAADARGDELEERLAAVEAEKVSREEMGSEGEEMGVGMWGGGADARRDGVTRWRGGSRRGRRQNGSNT
jgi:hypothetical protein